MHIELQESTLVGKVMNESADMISKHAKYNTANPISRYLVNNFFKTVAEIVSTITIKSVLDVGCGEGYLFDYLIPGMDGLRCHAIDMNPQEVADAKKNYPFARLKLAVLTKFRWKAVASNRLYVPKS